MYNSSVGLASVAPRTGGRGLKLWWCTLCDRSHCVAPRTGGRGLKFEVFEREAVDTASRPPHRGAWIEIARFSNLHLSMQVAPRTGGRGLKSHSGRYGAHRVWSPPHRGAWIEMDDETRAAVIDASPPAQGGVD